MLRLILHRFITEKEQRMSKIFTTEITSDNIASDNPIHQRLYKAYVVAESYIQGDVLEVGCGEGRGIDRVLPKSASFTAVDKIESALVKLRQKYPTGKFLSMNIPPLAVLPSNTFDVVITFQVIEHIEDDSLFLKEIHRVLKPGGIALVTTPNQKLSLTRNPWHIREYLAGELSALGKKYFSSVEMKGIAGNENVMGYYQQNKKSVARITKYDILNLQYRLPASFLRIPYELMNRWNRNKLQSQDNSLVKAIHHNDYVVTDNASEALDLLMICRK
jgi:2-polyprenyl-3-methyl-5-hydroxy-6-metoxy-1,4-benzoquinol methylase